MSKLTNVVLVDGNSFIYKSYYGYNNDKNMKDNDIKVLTGLMQSLYDIVKNVDKISHLFYVFDADDSDIYRKSLYTLYKANRLPAPEDLLRQKKIAKDIFKNKIGIPVIEYNGYEADDAIGSLSKIYEKDNNVVIVSPDKDLFQLINDRTMMLRPTKKDNKKVFEYISEKGVEKYYGVNANQIPDYLALVGDTCDNLPGIDKIGKITASYLLKKYNNIEDMYSVINDIKNQEPNYKKILTQFEENIDFIKLVKLLALVKTDLDLSKSIESSLNLAIDIQSSPAYFSRIENLAKEQNWNKDFISFLK